MMVWLALTIAIKRWRHLCATPYVCDSSWIRRINPVVQRAAKGHYLAKRGEGGG